MSQINVEAALDQVYTLWRSGDREGAAGKLAQMREEQPELTTGWLHGAFLYDRMGREAEAAPLYEEALRLGLEGINLRDALVCLGSTYRNIGRSQEAVTILERAREEFPDDLSAVAFLALALQDLGRGAEAVRLLGQALLQESQNPGLVRFTRALTYYFDEIVSK